MSTKVQLSFAAGEFSAALQGRVDLTKYAFGAKLLRNGYIRRDGGWDNRPGTSFCCEVKDSTKTIRQIPFEFSLDQTYSLEFGNLYMRVILDGSYVLEASKAITGISTATEAVFSVIAHGYSNSDEIFLSEIIGPDELNGRNYRVEVINATTFKLLDRLGNYLSTVGMDAYVSGGISERIFTLVTPYVEADLALLYYAQSADVMTIAHQSYAPREISRLAHDNWTISSISFVPSISAPSGFSAPVGTFNSYRVTAVQDETFEESLQSSLQRYGTIEPTPSAPITFTWSSVAGARYYRVYRVLNGVPGFVNTAASTTGTVTFTDIGITPDTTDTPPDSRNPFSGASNQPAVVALVSQRRFFANTVNDPERIDGSRVGKYRNFTISTPFRDDDALTFRIAGDKVNPVNHLINLKGLLVFTDQLETAVGQRDSGALTPFTLQQEAQSYNGSNRTKPLLIGNQCLYVQKNGKRVFNFGFDVIESAFKPGDVSAFASHLLEKLQVVDWSYQKNPNSIVWVVREDGALISFTYIKEQELIAWCRHDLDGGLCENVCCIPEGNEHSVYLTVKRTVDGRTVRYIERMNTRLIDDVRDMVFMDAAATYDGRNADVTNQMLLTGGINWDTTEVLNLQSSLASFTADDVGNAIQLYSDTDKTLDRLDLDIEVFTNTTNVQVRPSKNVETQYRGQSTANWVRAVDEVFGLWHLEGKNVSVLGDGAVVKSPYNKSYDPVLTVSGGTITLQKTYGVIQIGLPITADLQTLAIDSQTGETLIDKLKAVGQLTMRFQDSRGGFIGNQFPATDDPGGPLAGLYEVQMRENEAYGETPILFTGVVKEHLEQVWGPDGDIVFRQVDPLPVSLLEGAPAGMLPINTRGGIVSG